MNTNLKSTFALALVAGLFATGCPSPNTYGTARTVKAGQFSHTIAAEGIGAFVEVEDIDGDGQDDGSGNVFLPTFPTYQLRFGATESLEIGGRIANASSIGADVKWNFLKDSFVDAAIDPGFQWWSVSAGGADSSLTYLHLPFIVDINMSKAASLVLTPGALIAIAGGDVDNSNEFSSTGVIARGGIGLNLRISDSFSMQPEFTLLMPLDQGDSLTTALYSVGLGFNIANLPDFSDIE